MAQAVATDLAGGAEREIQHPALGERTAVLHRTADGLAVIEIGDHEDGAERFGAMRAGNLFGLEALAARVPAIFPIDRRFLVIGRRPGDPTHPLLLKRVGPSR